MRVEVGFTLHTDPANERDGTPRWVKSPGFHIPATSMQEWFDGTEPAEAAQFSPTRLENMRYQMLRDRWFCDPARTAREVAEIRFGGALGRSAFIDAIEALLEAGDRSQVMAMRETIREGGMSVAEAQDFTVSTRLLSGHDTIAECLRRRGHQTTHGADTNWGRVELMHKGFVLLDLTPAEAHEILTKPVDAARHPAEIQRTRAMSAYRVNYRAILSPPTVTDFHNPDLVVHLNRGIATPPTASEAIVDA